jgi:tetratricopeptide (TPR) repeat protein
MQNSEIQSPATPLAPADYDAGISAAKEGNHRLAADAFQRATEFAPGHAPSHANLGTALAILEDFAGAVRALEIAVRLNPDDVNSLANLASCLSRLERHHEAASMAEKALIQNPAHVSALRTIATSCLAIGDGRKAVKGARGLAKLKPSREADELLVGALLAAGEYDDAEAAARRYVDQISQAVSRAQLPPEKVRPAIGTAELLLAHVIQTRLRSMKPTGPHLLYIRRRRQELVELLTRVASDVDSAEGWFALGRASYDLQQHDQALNALRKAVARKNDHVPALEMLGDVLIERSQNDEAVDVLNHALELNPRQSKALLMRVRTAADASERAAFHSRLDEYLALPGARPFDRINWHFAKGQLFDRSKDYEQAFEHYLQAGRLKEERHLAEAGLAQEALSPEVDPYEQHQRHFDGSRQAFTPQFFESRKGTASPSRRPIFVVGVPRSGTTLMEQILASHPQVAGAGELPEFSSFAARCHDITRPFGGYPDAVDKVPTEALASFRDEYLAQLERVDPTAEHVVDKMPGNLIHVGLIHTLFPNAAIIRIRREPRDVCVSALKNHLDYPLCNLEKTARFCVACDRLTELWNEILPGRLLVVSYEALVTDLEPNVRRILDHCGLDWDDQCLNFHQTDRNVRTPSRWQVRKPAYSSSIGAWKRYASALTHLDAILGPPDA